MENSLITLSLIIPTYNEEKNIVELIKKTNAILDKASISHEFIIVDDGSKDQTRPGVKELKTKIDNINLIERDNEKGLASAMVCGYNAARGTYLGSMDADLAHDPKYLPNMLSMLTGGAYDFVIGSRYLPESKFFGKPFLNKMASLVGQKLVKVILGIKVGDTSNNYRIFSKSLWNDIKSTLHPSGNIMLTEIVYRAEQCGYRFSELPIVYNERIHGKSKLNIWKETARFFSNIIKIKFGK